MDADMISLQDELVRILSFNEDHDCPVLRTMELLSGKWRLYVIHELCKRPVCRFSELKKGIPGITNTMLTSTLKELEQIGLVHREQFNEVPPHVEYSLTEKGHALVPAFYELTKWGLTYLDT